MENKFLDGPDQILPAYHLISTELNKPVMLRIPENGQAMETVKPISVPKLLQTTAKKYSHYPALAYKVYGKWRKISYKTYLAQVRICAKAFIKLGLERYHSVCILGCNSPEWFLSDLGAIFAGGIAVGMNYTNSSEACFHYASSSKANIIVVQDKMQLKKILDIKLRLPLLKAIIQYEGVPTEPGVISWFSLMDIGSGENDKNLDTVLKTIAVNECCTIIFSSGTTEEPKALLLSHDNLTWNASVISERIKIKKGKERIVSYLTPSQVSFQVVDIYTSMMNGVCVYFVDTIRPLRGTLWDTLRTVRPTKFLAVPKIWEKIYEKIMELPVQKSGIKKTVASWAKNQVLQHHLSFDGTNTKSLGYRVARSVMLEGIKHTLGLSCCTFFVSTSAPLAADIKLYFLSMDIPIMEAYGMSETSGGHTLCISHAPGIETVGQSFNGVKTKIHNAIDGYGEICMNGRHIFMGYLEDEKKTRELIDAEGWLHSGDIGRIDENGFIYITGRIKEIMITSGGEKVQAAHVEQLIKSALPHIRHAFLVGDTKKYLSVLLTLKTDMDADSEEISDTLLPSVQKWLNNLGCPASTVSEVLQNGPDSRLLDAIKEGIEKVNQKAVGRMANIRKFYILPADFSVATGELGPTLEIKRNFVETKYKNIIEKMYA